MNSCSLVVLCANEILRYGDFHNFVLLYYIIITVLKTFFTYVQLIQNILFTSFIQFTQVFKACGENFHNSQYEPSYHYHPYLVTGIPSEFDDQSNYINFKQTLVSLGFGSLSTDRIWAYDLIKSTILDFLSMLKFRFFLNNKWYFCITDVETFS